MSKAATLQSEKPWLWWTLAAAFALVPVVLLLVPLPIGGRVGPSLGNMCHGPLFACLTIVGIWLWNARTPPSGTAGFWRACIVAALLTLAGAGMEFVQAFFGRTPSIHDGLANAFGAFASVGGFIARSSRTATRRVLGLISMITLIGWTWKAPIASIADHYQHPREWPTIDSFERAAGLERWYTAQHKMIRKRGIDGVTEGQYAAQILFEEGERGWVTLFEFRSDWIDFDTFELDATLPHGIDDASIAIQLVSKSSKTDELAVARKDFELFAGQTETLKLPYLTSSKDSSDVGAPALRADRMMYVDIHWISKFPGSVVLDNLRLSSTNPSN
ncbi:MAG: hypothetical protein AAF664_07665 [Planctomycetota bacterium]